MSYKYSLPILGSALVAYGLLERGGWLIAAWLGANFVILGIAHGKHAPRVLGKRRDGSLPLWSWIVFLPLHLYTLGVWHLARWLSREPRTNNVGEELVVGRRLLPWEREGEFANYVDLTAEFEEPSAIRRDSSYRSFPILDGAAPEIEALRAEVSALKPGRTFVHCAQGHGRTGLFALAMLLTQGKVGSVDEGLQLLRSVRPGIQLNGDQLACLRKFAEGIGE